MWAHRTLSQRPRAIAVCVGTFALAICPLRADAQTPPPAEPTIEITATPTPPPVTRIYVPAPLPDEDEDDAGPVVVVPRRTAAPAAQTQQAINALWRRHIGLGFTTGGGSPLGVVGAFAEVNLHPMFGFMIGGGGGGTFGPAIGGTAHFRPVHSDHFAPYVGVGLSTNFTPGQYQTNPSISTPGNSWWLNFEVGAEYRSSLGLGMRLGFGWNVLLNTGAFTNREFMNFYGPRSNTDFGWDPVSAADAHDEGHPLGFPYVHFDVLGLFNL